MTGFEGNVLLVHHLKNVLSKSKLLCEQGNILFDSHLFKNSWGNIPVEYHYLHQGHVSDSQVELPLQFLKTINNDSLMLFSLFAASQR